MASSTFPGRFENLARIDEFVRQGAELAGLNEDDIYSVRIAVEEACSNIIEHAYGGEGKGSIFCTVCPDESGLTITLVDHGLPFDPRCVPPPNLHADLSHRKEGGLGLYFIQKLMDEIHFDSSANSGNQLILIKRKRIS
ncbi:MAG: ATP-binding protein [Chloroflexi bacterium]|nr:ATP-binding protein [Chloroflexota bacterium]